MAAALLTSGDATTAALAARIESAGNRPPVQLPRLLAVAVDIQIPPLLAPFLADSPCATALHVNVLKRKHVSVFPVVAAAAAIGSSMSSSAGRRGGSHGANGHVEYSVSRMDHVSLARVAPLVDQGGLLGGAADVAVGSQVAELVKLTTDQADLAEAVDVRAMVPLMFGQVGECVIPTCRHVISSAVVSCESSSLDGKLILFWYIQKHLITRHLMKKNA